MDATIYRKGRSLRGSGRRSIAVWIRRTFKIVTTLLNSIDGLQHQMPFPNRSEHVETFGGAQLVRVKDIGDAPPFPILW